MHPACAVEASRSRSFEITGLVMIFAPSIGVPQLDCRKPHVRVYSEERERPVLFVVDQRISMFFGSARTTKATAATELAALGAWKALDGGDRVGALIFSGRGDCRNQTTPQPKQRPANLSRTCKTKRATGSRSTSEQVGHIERRASTCGQRRRT